MPAISTRSRGNRAEIRDTSAIVTGGASGLGAATAVRLAHMSYDTDLSEEQWALIEPLITAWKGAHPTKRRIGYQVPYRPLM